MGRQTSLRVALKGLIFLYYVPSEQLIWPSPNEKCTHWTGHIGRYI